MNHLSLFSGIGGIDKAAEEAGFVTVAYCEKAKYPADRLNERFPGAVHYEDVKDVSRVSLQQAGIEPDSIRLVSGGFPCQPWSLAGERKGEADDRHLWPENIRILQDIGADWFVGENVIGFIDLALDKALSDLASIGYSARPFVLPACAVGAPDTRLRVFIVAHADRKRLPRGEKSGSISEIWTPSDEQLARLQPADFWTEVPMPRINGVGHGIPHRVERTRALGNAVKPQHIFPILKAIATLEGAA